MDLSEWSRAGRHVACWLQLLHDSHKHFPTAFFCLLFSHTAMHLIFLNICSLFTSIYCLHNMNFSHSWYYDCFDPKRTLLKKKILFKPQCFDTNRVANVDLVSYSPKHSRVHLEIHAERRTNIAGKNDAPENNSTLQTKNPQQQLKLSYLKCPFSRQNINSHPSNACTTCWYEFKTTIFPLLAS